MKLQIALSFLLGTVSGDGCSGGDKNVAEVVCGTESLSILCQAVSKYPNLVETFVRDDVTFTLFAPNDAGFSSDLIPGDLLEDEAMLTNLLLNHVIVGFHPVCSDDLVCSNLMYMANGSERGQRTKTACAFDGEPPQGDDASGSDPTSVYQKGDGNGSKNDNMPQIISADNKASNGVIHIINNVILQKDSFGAPADDDQKPPTDDDQKPPTDDDGGSGPQCSGGKACGECKGECQDNDGCRFSKVGWCKRDCEERFPLGTPEGCTGGDDQSPKVCFGGFDCFSCQAECAASDNECGGREPVEECQAYCEEKWGGCQCTGGVDCATCKGECGPNDGCRFSSSGYCKRDCEERFPLGSPEQCTGGDDQSGKICFGGNSCGSCKRECQDNEGCGRESTGQCKGYCEQKWGPC